MAPVLLKVLEYQSMQQQSCGSLQLHNKTELKKWRYSATRMLDQRGAFTLRRAVEDVADAMGVSRITVYNYLNALHR